MELKKNKCPNCGANLEYDSRKNKYVCQYCDSVYVDSNQDKKSDPRVELTPDDLKNSNANGPTSGQASPAVVIVIVIIFFIIIFSVFSFISNFLMF